MDKIGLRKGLQYFIHKKGGQKNNFNQIRSDGDNPVLKFASLSQQACHTLVVLVHKDQSCEWGYILAIFKKIRSYPLRERVGQNGMRALTKVLIAHSANVVVNHNKQ